VAMRLDAIGRCCTPLRLTGGAAAPFAQPEWTCYCPKCTLSACLIGENMKPWHIVALVLLLVFIAFVAWLVVSFRKGRDGR
jgi:hypothetical protein